MSLLQERQLEQDNTPIYVRPRRTKPQYLLCTPILQLGNTLQLESKTKAAQSIHASLN